SEVGAQPGLDGVSLGVPSNFPVPTDDGGQPLNRTAGLHLDSGSLPLFLLDSRQVRRSHRAETDYTGLFGGRLAHRNGGDHYLLSLAASPLLTRVGVSLFTGNVSTRQEFLMYESLRSSSAPTIL